MSESSIQAEGDLDGGKDKDPQGDGGHVGVESENVIDVGTSFRSPTEHSTNGNDELRVAPNLYPLSSKADRMSVMTLPIPNVPLHSPSNTIIGTPFATDSTPYEYPFPDHSTTTDRPFSSSLTSLSPSSSFPSLSSGSSFAIASSSSPQLPSLATTPPTISPLAHFLPDLSQKYSPTHPKLRQGNPPVPPALIKKRQRWSLGLLRKRSSSGSSSSVGPLSSSEALSDTASERVSKPLPVTGVTQEVVMNNSQRQQKIVREEENTKVQRLD